MELSNQLPLNQKKEFWTLQFSLFRKIFGLYLAIHFLYLIPYAQEIFGAAGTLETARMNLMFGLFPNILLFIQNKTLALEAGLVILALFSVASIFLLSPFIYGVLWYGWAAYFNLNNLILNPILHK